MNGTLRVLIAEPSDVVTGGLRMLLEEAGGFHVATAISDLSILDERLRLSAADIAIINPSLVEKRYAHNLKSAFPSLQNVKTLAMVYGVFDDELLRQFDAVAKIVDPQSSIISKLLHIATEESDGQGENTYDLTDREREILIAVARGWTNKEIADKHNISIHTVISHRKNITRKTGIKSVAGLTVYAMLNNMIDRYDME